MTSPYDGKTLKWDKNKKNIQNKYLGLYLQLLGQTGAWLCIKYGSRYYWGMAETVPFFVRGRIIDSEGGLGAGIFKKINILAVKHLKINILAWVPRKMVCSEVG